MVTGVLNAGPHADRVAAGPRAQALANGRESCGDPARIVVLGGSATLGKTVARPYPALVAEAMGERLATLAGPNAGPDFHLADPGALHRISRADLAVVQVAGADRVSNPFYTVHPRRNDRFLSATPALSRLYPEVDLADIHFTRHLLMVLEGTDARRFQTVAAALKSTWLDRMRELLVHLPLRRVLLVLPEGPCLTHSPGRGPLLVDDDMLAALGPSVSALVEGLPEAAMADSGAGEEAAHHAVAAVLGPVLSRLLA